MKNLYHRCVNSAPKYTAIFSSALLNSCHCGLFRYALKTSDFFMFSGVSKETSGMKWVNMPGLGNPEISKVFGHFFKIMLKDFYRYVFVNRVSNDF